MTRGLIFLRFGRRKKRPAALIRTNTKAMHILLSGACPLIKLRLNNSGLSLGFLQQHQPAYCIDSNTETLSIHFSGHSPESEDLQWASLDTVDIMPHCRKGLQVHSLVLECHKTRVQLESCELAAEFQLRITGSENVLQIWRLSGMRLTLEAAGDRNSVLFAEPEAPLQEVSLRLTGCHNTIEGLWLLGCSHSSISVANCSVVVAALEPDTQERQIEFDKDPGSTITVYLPLEQELRQVHARHEIWAFDSTLITIFTHPKARPLTRPPPPPSDLLALEPVEQRFICGVCRTAAPDHLLQPCGHLFFCASCYAQYTNHQCPVCRGAIANVQRIFPTVGC